jgi:hypothetical protein
MGGFGCHRWTNGHRALDFYLLQFSIESLQKITVPDVLMISGASFHSTVMCTKRLLIRVGE